MDACTPPKMEGLIWLQPGEAAPTNKDTKYIKLPASFSWTQKKSDNKTKEMKNGVRQGKNQRNSLRPEHATAPYKGI